MNIQPWPDTCEVNDVPTFQCLETVISNIIVASSALIIVGLFIMLIVGSLRYLTSGGNPEKLKKAQGTLMYALMGTVLFVSAFLILKIIDVLFLGNSGKLFRLNLP